MIKAQSVLQAPARWQVQSILFAGTLAGSWAAIFARLAQHEHIPTVYIIAFRMALGTLVLSPFVLRHYQDELRRLQPRQILFAAGAGFWMAIHLVSGFASLEHTSILVSNVLVGSSPMWIALIETVILRTRLSRMVWIGLIVTLSGGAILAFASGVDMTLGDNPSLGIALALGAALAGSLYAIMGCQSRERMSLLPYIWLAFVFGSVTSITLTLLAGVPLTGYSSTGYVYLIMLTVLPQLIGHTTYNYALRHLSATYASVVGQLGMVLSAMWAVFVFNEIPGPLQLPGSAAILVGILLVNLGQHRRD